MIRMLLEYMGLHEDHTAEVSTFQTPEGHNMGVEILGIGF